MPASPPKNAIKTSHKEGLVLASNSELVSCKGVKEKYKADVRILTMEAIN